MEQLRKRACNVVMIAILLACATSFAYDHDRKLAMEQELLALRQAYLEEPEPEEIPAEEAVDEPVEEPLIYCDAVIDFVGLREENADIYAWLQVPGTRIDYPVLQCEEDNYYLSHNVDGSQGYPGSIYTNQCNAKDFSDSITVMYGHNMKNGTMFAGLHNFEDEDFFAQNEEILVYTDTARYTYGIYMAAAYGDPYIPALFDVKTGEGAVAFCREVSAYEDERKLIRQEMEITEEDCLLILSTCIAKEDTKRYLVIGKLLEIAYYSE